MANNIIHESINSWLTESDSKDVKITLNKKYKIDFISIPKNLSNNDIQKIIKTIDKNYNKIFNAIIKDTFKDANNENKTLTIAKYSKMIKPISLAYFNDNLIEVQFDTGESFGNHYINVSFLLDTETIYDIGIQG